MAENRGEVLNRIHEQMQQHGFVRHLEARWLLTELSRHEALLRDLENRLKHTEAALLRARASDLFSEHYSWDSDKAEQEARKQLIRQGLLRPTTG